MKKYIYYFIGICFITIIGFAWSQSLLVQKYKKLYNKELLNVEAYAVSNSALEKNAREFTLTIDELKNSKDSIDNKLAQVIKELRIKENKIQYLQYQKSIISKTDTIFISEPVFNEEVFIDTIVYDPWYTMKLHLEYPNVIVTTPTFDSEQYTIIHSKKVFNSTPSKIFFIRWFQKKHYVVEIEVKEKNPYITTKQHKYIKIIE